MRGAVTMASEVATSRCRSGVNAPEGAQGGTKRGPRACAGVAGDLAHARVMSLTSPRPCAVTHRGRGRMAATRALPGVGREPRVVRGHGGGYAGVAGLPVRMVAAPPARLARVTHDEAEPGGTILGSGARPGALRGTSTGWSGGIALRRAVVPRRAGSAHPPQRRCQSSRRPARWRSGGLGGAAAASAAVGVPPQRARQSGRRRTSVAGCGRVLAKTGPVTSVSSPAPARQRSAGQGPCARHRRRSVPPARGHVHRSQLKALPK